MKKRIDFPLFETMLIIMVLSVLAIFALPKFVDVGIEARIKTLNATALNLSSVNRMLYSRALIKGVQDNPLQKTDSLGESNAGAYLVYGELRAQEEDLKRFLDIDLIKFSPTNTPGTLRLYLDNFKNEGCYLDYVQASLLENVQGKFTVQRAYSRIKSTGC